MSTRLGETTHLRLTLPILRARFIDRSVSEFFGLATGLAFRFVGGGDSCSQDLGDFGTSVADLIYQNYAEFRGTMVLYISEGVIIDF